MVAEHLLWMQKHYWQSRYSVSFPRLRPCTGGVEPASVMDEKQLVPNDYALSGYWRPEIDIITLHRESPWFRDHVIPLAINNVSAFSKTQPGRLRWTIIRNWSSFLPTMPVGLKQ
ncbi:thiamine biosynthesis protein [Salmonella enterica subsp. enterica]|nr:thiamine biosynthesis protein [Salmonella enterica subsp. enterica]